MPLAQSSLATLAAGFSIESADEDGSFTATDKIVIKNANNEAVDMSGWKMTGAVTFTFPAGSVIDANGTITVVADRKTYVAANTDTLTDEVLLGNAVFAGSGTVNLFAADETPVIQGDPVEATGYDGEYNEEVVINRSGEYVFSNAVFNAGIKFGDGNYIVKRQKGYTSTATAITCAGNITFTGKGELDLTGPMTVNNLIVSNGTFAVTGSAELDTTNTLVTVNGNFLVDGGAVTIDTFSSEGTVYGIFLASKNMTAEIRSGSFAAEVGGAKSSALRVNKGSSATAITGGELTAKLYGESSRFIDVDGTLAITGSPSIRITDDSAGESSGISLFAAANPAANLRAIKAAKAVTIEGGSISVSVTGDGSEAISSESSIAISGGTVDLRAGDDCLSAQGNIDISGGKVYANSTGNDAIDANGNITINGGLVLAYTTATEADDNGSYGLDVNNTEANPHTITVNGGTLVALSGPGATYAQPAGTQTVICTNNITAVSDFSNKYITLTGTEESVTYTTTIGLPAIDTDDFSMLLSVPGLVQDAEVAFSDTAPETGSINFHDVYRNEVVPPAAEGPVAEDPNVVWNSDGGMFVYENFGRAVKLTVNYETTEPLTNFPVLVKLAENNNLLPGFTYADFYNDAGADLVFVDDAGKVIPHEIDTWNRSGTSLVWVKVPVVTNGATFAMCYRSAKDGSKLATDGVWNDYTGVWHLGEKGNGKQTVLDSTTNDLDMVSHENSLAEVSGAVGAARRISTKIGASDANGRVFIDLSQDAAKKAKVDDLGTSFVASFWAKLSGDPAWAYLIGRKATDNDLSWAMQFNSATEQNSIRIFTDANNQSQNTTVNAFANLKTAWIKVDLVYNNNNFIIYCNGALASQGNTLNNTTAKQQGDFAFGGCAGSGYGSFNGWMDEVRLRKGVPSAAWVAADHATQATDTFLAAAAVVEIAEKPIPVVDLQLVDSGARYAQFSAKAGNFGGTATSCAVEYKLWAAGDAEPADYTELIDSLVLNETAGKLVTGLLPETKYCYKLRANNSLSGGTSEDVVGEFTTGGTGEPGVGGDRYRVHNDYVHKYIIGTEDMTFTPPSYVTKFAALIVGGGGAGGYRHGGGGGAGGLVYTEVDVSPGETFTVSVGAGGVASSDISVLGANGGDSTLSKNGDVIRRAVGGGAGGNCYVNPAINKDTGKDWSLTQGSDGGSGGGNGYFNYDESLGDDNYATRYNKHRGQGTANQGFNGGVANVGIKNITGANNGFGSVSGGGGGGAGKVGGDASEDDPPGAGAGGAGKQYDISGKTLYYAGGGAGGTFNAGDRNTFSIGGAGGGGNGGWSRTMATPGEDGLGGGGGGGSGDTGYYQGANGGSGCVYIRYSVQGNGAGSAKPVGSLTAAELVDGLMKVKIDYRAAWAGEGYELCDVYAAYGTTPNALTGEALIAQGTIGTGSGEFSLNAPDTLFYIRLRLKNAAGEVNDSDDIYEIRTGSLGETPSTVLTLASSSVAGGNLSATINSTEAGTVWRLTGAEYGGDSLAGWTKESLGPIAANGSLEDTVAIDDVNFVRYALEKSDGSYEFTETIVLAKLDVPALGEPTATANAISATVTGEATSFGLSEQGTLRLYVSKVNDIATCKLKAQIENQPIGEYSIDISDLEPFTTYYYYVEALSENGGAAKSELKSFSTLGVSLASRQASVDQRNVTFSAMFGQIPSDIDSVMFKLKISLDGSAGEEVEVANSVTAGPEYSHMVTAEAFGVKVEAEYIAVCTTGDKVWRQSLDKIAATTVDTATYTWGANDQGELSGNWNDPAHWQCDKDQRSDLPGVNSRVRFAPDATEAYTVTLTADTIVGNIDFTGNTARNISIAGHGKQLSYTSLASLNSPSSSGLKLTFDNVVLTGTNVVQATSFAENWPGLTTGNVAAELRFVNHSSARFTDFSVCGNSSRVEVASGSTLRVNKFALAGNGTVATIDNATIIATENIVLPDNVDNSSLTIELKGENPLLKAEGTNFQWFGGENTKSELPVVFRCFVPVDGWTSAPVQDDSIRTNGSNGACLFAKPYNNGAVQAKFRFEVAPESPIVGSGAELTAIPIVTTANGIYTNNVEELAAIDDTEHKLSGGFAYSEAMNQGGDYPLNLVLNLTAGQIAASVPTTDDGTVEVSGEGENAVAVITPNEGVTSVTVTVPASYTGKIQVPASVNTVSGVTLAQLVVVANAPYGETTVDISAAFKATLAENGSITIALDPAASVQVGDDTIAVRPLIVEADDASIADGSVAAKTIPGLYYQLVRWSSLAADKTETVVVDRTLATGTTLKLTDPNKPADTAFYIIRVDKK
ncbi:MAG: glycine-rich domain-containing protein [Kiritimatiellia bacterium]